VKRLGVPKKSENNVSTDVRHLHKFESLGKVRGAGRGAQITAEEQKGAKTAVRTAYESVGTTKRHMGA